MRPRFRPAIPLLPILFLLAAPTTSAQIDRQDDRTTSRSSFIIPSAGGEIGSPRLIPATVDPGRTESLAISSRFGLALLFPKLGGGAFGAGVHGSLIRSDGWFESRIGPSSEATVDAGSGAPVESSSRIEVDVEETHVEVALFGLWDPEIDRLRVALGPWFGYRVGGRVVETERIVRPRSARFAANGRDDRLIGSGDVGRTGRLRYGLGGRVSYDIPVSSIVALSPWLGTDLDARSLLDEERGLASLSLQLGLGFSVAWRPDPIDALTSLLAPPPTPTDIEFTRILSSELDHSTLRIPIDTVRLAERIVRERRIVGIPRTVAVDDVPTIISSASTTPSLDPASLPLLETDSLLPLLPLILGDRMSRDEGAMLRIEVVRSHGTESPDATGAASRLRQHLIDRFSLDESRIAITSIEDDRTDTGSTSEADLLRFASDGPSLFDPIMLDREIVDLVSPTITLRRSQQSEEPEVIEVRQDDELIGRVEGGSGSFSIARRSLDRDGGVIVATLLSDRTLPDRRLSDHQSTDTLHYRMLAPIELERTHFVLPVGPDGTVDETTRILLSGLIAEQTGGAGEGMTITLRSRGEPERIAGAHGLLLVSIAPDQGITIEPVEPSSGSSAAVEVVILRTR